MKKLPACLLATISLIFAACASPDAGPSSAVSAPLPELRAGVWDVRQVTIEPLPVRRGPPAYPQHLRRRGISGEAVVAFVVGVDGKVSDVIVTSATHADFAQAAAAAVRQWVFEPAQLNGKPVPCRIPELRITFDS